MTDLGKVAPRHGGRIQLKLVDGDERAAQYDVTLSFGESVVTRRVRVAADGTVSGWPTDVEPAWLGEYAVAVLRLTARQRVGPTWPRRTTRWRNAPEGRRAPSSQEPTE